MEIIKPLVYIQEFDRPYIESKLKDIDMIVANFGPEHPIIVQIDSYGGEVAGLSMLYNRLKTLQNPIITYTSSVAMSCGALLLILGASSKEGNNPMRIASEGAEIMIHDFSYGDGGDIKDLKSRLKSSEKNSEYWFDLLAKSLNLKSREDVMHMIHNRTKGSHALFLSAKEALDMGLIDMIGDIILEPYQGYNISIKQPMPTDKPEVKKTKKKVNKKK